MAIAVTPENRGRAWGAKLRGVFAIDLRSLALFRMGLALGVLLDLATRARDLTAHYTDAGVFPADLAIALQGRGILLSLHYWTGATTWLQASVFIATGACALALLVGWRTRLATIACWYLVSSLQVRQPLVYIGGDSILRLLLFWSLFLPLAARFSLDDRQDRLRPRSNVHLSGASMSLLLQVCLIYWATGIQKSGSLWWGGEAVSYALEAVEWATPVGRALLAWPSFMEVLTYTTLVVELVGPFLALMPIRTAEFRVVAIVLFWGFHLGLAASMNVGLFPLFSMVGWLAFIPTKVWTALRCDPPRERSLGSDRRSLVASVAALVILAYVTVVVAERAGVVPRFVPSTVHEVGRVLRVQQTWEMFAPNPPNESADIEVRLTLEDGTERSAPAASSFRWVVYFDRVRPRIRRDPILRESVRRFAQAQCAREPWSDVAGKVRQVTVLAHVRLLGLSDPIAPLRTVLAVEACPVPPPT